MRRLAPMLIALALTATMVVVPVRTRGQEPFPTPRGRLGGPEPLQLTPVGGEPTVPPPASPVATATPVEPTPSTAVAAASPMPLPTVTPAPADAASARGWEDVVAGIGPAVVTVLATRSEGGLIGEPEAEPAGFGSGFFVDERGHVATAAGVVREADEVTVVLADGERRPASLVGLDELTGVALLRVEGAVPAVARLGDAGALPPGRTVLAIGTAYAALPHTVAQGVVSAVERELPDVLPATQLIQHDASAYPGLEGGPLVSAAGEVVGMQVVVDLDALGEGLPGIPGIDLPDVPGVDVDVPALPGPPPGPQPSFAVPSATISRVAAALIADGRVSYPYFGAELRTLTPDDATERGLPVASGVLVGEVVDGGPAATAGVEAGDVIAAVDGEPVDSQAAFIRRLFAHAPGDAVDVAVRRDGVERTLTVILGERPAE